MTGQKVCRVHGGSAPRAIAAAKRRQEEEKLRRQLTHLGFEIEADPFDTILAQVREAAANVAYLRQRVQELTEIYGQVLSVSNSGALVATGEAKEHILVKMYNEERTALLRACKMAIDSGIAERTVKIAEQQSTMIVTVILAVLDSQQLGLTDEQKGTAKQLAAEQIRRLASAN